MKKTLQLLLLLLTILVMVTTLIQATELATISGYWKTFARKTKEANSIVKIWLEERNLKGKIVKLFPKPGEDPDPKCTKCKGDNKDKQIFGMEILWNFVGQGRNWKSGKILDPDNGKVYHCKMTLSEDGKTLKIFGYIKMLIKIGRSESWIRVKEKDIE